MSTACTRTAVFEIEQHVPDRGRDLLAMVGPNHPTALPQLLWSISTAIRDATDPDLRAVRVGQPFKFIHDDDDSQHL
jgi:hypothetical protein